MRHRVHGRKLGRTSAHRKALFRNQLTALFTHDRIVTTLAKAKELRPLAEKMVTQAKTGSLPARRKVATMVQDPEILRRLFEEIAPRFAERSGGYTRIMRLGRRHGDGAELAIIEFVDYVLEEKSEGESSGKPSFMDRAKGMFGGGTQRDAEAAEESPEAEAETATDEDEAAAADTPAPETEAEVEAEEPEAAEAEAEDEEKKDK